MRLGHVLLVAVALTACTPAQRAMLGVNGTPSTEATAPVAPADIRIPGTRYLHPEQPGDCSNTISPNNQTMPCNLILNTCTADRSTTVFMPLIYSCTTEMATTAEACEEQPEFGYFYGCPLPDDDTLTP